MILVWILVIAAVVVLMWSLIGSSDRRESRERQSPLETLKQRYAAGEIDRDEFEEKKHDLVGRD